MPEVSAECEEFIKVAENKKTRFSPTKLWTSSNTTTPTVPRTLELEGVIEVLREYESVEGSDINCCICGELSFDFTVSVTDIRAKIQTEFNE